MAIMKHDARRVVENLRDHLARHDKPIAFLFGAGTSCAVKTVDEGSPLIPAVVELTQICSQEVMLLGKKFAGAWKTVEAKCATINENPNIEDILSMVRTMLGAISSSDKLAGLGESDLKVFEETIQKTIARIAQPPPERIPDKLPHNDFARWVARVIRQPPVEIFTTNYDVLIEKALEAERIPVFDGFVGSYRPFFHSDSLRRVEVAPGATWARLWKIHGSVNWKLEEQGGHQRIVRVEPHKTGEMILPSHHKYDESRQQPYIALLERLGRVLDQDDALMVTVGYSFSDEHINNVIFNTLDSKPRTHVFALQFEEPETHDLIERAMRRSNLLVLGPSTGVIGGTRGEWRLFDPVEFMEVAFDTTTEGESNGDGNTGQMKLGDFNHFCKFLASMKGA